MDFYTIISIAGPTALVTGGVAYGSAKQALNGTRDRVKKLEQSHEELKTDTIDRLARIETKVDSLIDR